MMGSLTIKYEQNIEWGSRRIGNKGYQGMPCHAQKKRTARAERVKYRVQLIKVDYLDGF